MNLIQVQERLKDMPLNAIISYANGSSPEVPAWIALSEIERRNRTQESAQQATPPDASVKEQAERKAVEQGMNQMAADQARQQQAAQQMTQQMAQPQQAPQAPMQQPMQAPQGMANGGIARVAHDDIFNFGGGGIVAFAGGGGTVENSFKEEKPKQRSVQRVQKEAPPDYLRMSEEALNAPAPTIQSPREALAEARKTSPTLQQPIGSDYEQKIKSLATQDEANRKAFEAREEEAARRDFYNSLIAAGEATRGGQGIGALAGGFGRAYSASRESADERRARQEALRREQDMNIAKLNFEIQNARRAEERGDIEAQQKHETEIAKIQAKLQETRAGGYKDIAQTQQTGQYYKDIVDVQRRQAGQQQTPEFVKLVDYFKKQNPNLTNEQAYDMATKYSKSGIAGEYAGERASSKVIADIQKKFTSQLQMARQSGNKSLEEQLTNQMNEEIRRATGGIPGAPTGGTTRIKVDAQGNPIQ